MHERRFRRLFAAAAVLVIGTAALLYYPPLWQNTRISPAAYRQNKEDKLDLNSASAAQLTALPGIGKTRAKAIVLYREQNGAFTSLEELRLVNGVSEQTFLSIRDFLFIE